MEKERFLPSLLNTGVYGGKLYALPRDYESMHLFYNKDVFSQNAELADAIRSAECRTGDGERPSSRHRPFGRRNRVERARVLMTVSPIAPGQCRRWSGEITPVDGSSAVLAEHILVVDRCITRSRAAAGRAWPP